MPSSSITIPSHNGKSFDAYLSVPPAGKGPGLVLIQEIWGVNAHIQAVADAYALDGYVVLAPDVFWRQEPGTDLRYDEVGTQKAYALMKNLYGINAGKDLVATARCSAGPGAHIAVVRPTPDLTGEEANSLRLAGGVVS